MKQIPIASWVRRKYDFRGSLYRETCPACGAEPLCWCVDRNGKSRKGYPHPARRGVSAPELSRRGYHQEERGAA